MSSFKKLYHSLCASSPIERRAILTKKMSELGSSGIDCSSCKGTCCSFIANSMKTTPIETLDILIYLEERDLITDELIEKLKETVNHYRLDYDIDTGRGSSIRRTYNCPFYSPSATGCGISRHNKPYGCLGFNAFKSNSSEGENCSPDFKLLEEREKSHIDTEASANQRIKAQLNLNWDKLPMPLALLCLIDKIRPSIPLVK